MAILKIARMGHPILSGQAETVIDPGAPVIRRLVADMIDTMVDAPGLGLAAPQVYMPKRVIIFHVPQDRAAPGEGPQGLTILINPVVEPLSDEMVLGWEGCLSVPGLRGLVPRYNRVRYMGFTPDGVCIEREATGMHARVVQHEFDHLDGVLYPQRMTDLSKLIFESEWRHQAPTNTAPVDPEMADA